MGSPSVDGTRIGGGDRRHGVVFRREVALCLQSMLLVACAHEPAPPAAPAPETVAVEFETSCSPAVRADFNQAVSLLHHMTYPQARTAFAAILARDPACAMAQWGIAMTLFQPLWPTRPSAGDLRDGWQAVQAALATPPPTPRERAYIEAMAAFFREPDAGDYWQRIARWELQQKAIHERYPGDPDASAFYALALLANAKPGPALRQRSEQAAELLLAVYRQNPLHPGAMHYLIHANDVPGRESDNGDIVRRYEEIAPDNPHALHMPTHIYTRLGDWDGVVRGNLRAANAALRYPAGPDGTLVWDEFPHAIEYLVYAYLQQGADERAAAQIERLFATPNLEPSAKTAFHLASTRARYALERRAWREAAALTPREPAIVDWDRFPWPEAIAWFARGYGALRLGDRAEAQRAANRMKDLRTRAEAAGETLFANQILTLDLELTAWLAHASGDDDTAVALLRQASELEGNIPKPPVTPAATLPAPELLGDLLLELGRAREAAVAYRESLQRFPRRFNGTLGLARALQASGDEAAAAQQYCALSRIGAEGTRAAAIPDVARAMAAQACLVARGPT